MEESDYLLALLLSTCTIILGVMKMDGLPWFFTAICSSGRRPHYFKSKYVTMSIESYLLPFDEERLNYREDVQACLDVLLREEILEHSFHHRISASAH